MKSVRRSIVVVMMACFASTLAMAQGGPGRGQGRGFGRGAGAAGDGQDQRHQEDHEVFQFLLTNHQQITRKVTKLANGVETLTESDEPEIADKIKEHVQWMEYRVKETKPIRMRDPLFAELSALTAIVNLQADGYAYLPLGK